MTVNGLRKLTLLDFPGRVACTLFLAGCNMRCPFCHNAPLVIDGSGVENIPEDELLAFLKKRSGVLDGVCITGGEPTLRRELPELLRSIKALGYAVKLDTNGTNPDILAALIDEGLVDYVAMDIKNSPEKYSLTAGREVDMDAVRRSVAILMENKVKYEFRTTVVGGYHTADDFRAIGEWLRGAEAYFLQNFVDSGALLDPETRGASESDMKEYLEIMKQFVPAAELRGM